MSAKAGTAAMPMMAHCYICCDDRPLTDLRVLRCGHCFCATCTDEIKGRGIPCPVCRTPVRAKDGGPIFITLVDSKAAKARCIVDDLGKMDESTDGERVVKTGERIQEVLEQSTDANNDLLRLLLDAVEDFKTRIASFYATSKKQSSKIAALEKELSCVRRENGELSRDISKAKVLENEHKGLKLRVKDAERHTEAAVTLAERAKDDAVRLRERVMELQVTVDRERQGKEDVEQENKQLKAWLDGHKRLARAQREKYTALRNQVAQLKKGVESRSAVEDSLVVLDADGFSESLTPRSVSRSLARSAYDSTSRSDMLASDGFVVSPTPSFSHVSTNLPIQQENDFECLPGPRPFKGHWQPNGDQFRVEGGKRKLGVSTSFPIGLDRTGHTKGSVQLGPKRRLLL